jgi:hypothetical protein
MTQMGVTVSMALMVAFFDSSELSLGRNSVQSKTADELLVSAIIKANRNRIRADGIEIAVGQEATINTCRPDDKKLFPFIHLSRDITVGSKRPCFKNASNVAYWVRPVDGEYVRIIGIQWNRDGSSDVFYAVVGPPL